MRKRKQHSQPVNDLTRSLTPLDPNHTLIAVIEMSQQSWLVAGEQVRTPEGEPIPPNTRAELHREMERLRLVRE